MEAGTRYLTEKEVASLTGRALSTLRNERHLCRGIAYRKIGRSIRYRLDEVISFMESRKIIPSEEMRG